jgi:hypothetical protein
MDKDFLLNNQRKINEKKKIKFKPGKMLFRPEIAR